MRDYLKIRISLTSLLSISLFAIISCDSKKEKENNVIEIVTEAMDFQTIDTIPSGWNTFKYINNSSETHFFLFDKYPVGKTILDTEKEVGPPFQKGMDLINKGKSEEGFAEFNKLPAWFFEVVFSGGSGLVSPNTTSLTTIKLKPGYHIIECYVKMQNGMFHSNMGMAKEIFVTDKSSESTPPKASINITISSTEGISYDNTITKGSQIFSVHFNDQIAHENFVGHDINLVKLDKNANLKELEKWMNWADPRGLITPSPNGVRFLGGVNDMPTGSTGYFYVTLEPGDYAFISEVPSSLSKNMLITFTVSE
ncbi:MAG: hypothetical protein KUG51_01475 [Urechidicola sp.]|nr:hypothetical protein [Urechidicola sp.]